MNEKVEYIIFKEKEKTIHVVGFITDEDKISLTISLTKSYGNYIDSKTIRLENILSRQKVL